MWWSKSCGLSLAKMADFWEEECEDELVTMWQEWPCLFDVMVKTHSNRNAVVKAKMRIDSNIAHFFFLVNRGMFIPYASVYTVSTSAASGLVWKCSLEGQHLFSITAARIVAELWRFVTDSFIGVDGYHRRKGRNETAHDLFTTAHDDQVLLRLGQSWRSRLGFIGGTKLA